MKVVKFNINYINHEFPEVQYASKIHGIEPTKGDATYCGLHNEYDDIFEGKTTCPNCIEFITKTQRLIKGKDF